MPRPLPRRTATLALFVLALGVAPAHAGGGPEGVLLVVNARSAASKEIGNHYARLRDLPATNVLHLDYDGPTEVVDGATFRERVLLRVIEAINQRGLSAQIDTIAYSADFPWQVRLGTDYPEGVKLPRTNAPVASLTGATYLWQVVLAKSPAVVALDTNWFAPVPATNLQRCASLAAESTRGFRGRYGWSSGGLRAEKLTDGRRYLLSTSLGVTTGRGNSVAEVVESLRRAVLAEATPPTGTFYFVKNTNIRSSTRHDCYPQAAAALGALGAKAAVVEGVVPTGAKDVAGMTLGYADLGLDAAGLVLQPGAICEHFTSSGGSLQATAAQTPLSALIRLGAAGACGTVDEPFAVQAKFPTPALQVHYRRGASLAEAFYRSVAAPYQLLIVGDPLCQPWARRPALRLSGWPAVEAAATEVTLAPKLIELVEPVRLKPKATASPLDPGKAWCELYIDGRLSLRLPSGSEMAFSPEEVGPGWHELRVVGITPEPMEFQSRVQHAVVVPRRKGGPPSETQSPVELGGVTLGVDRMRTPLAGELRVRVAAPGAERVEVRQHSRLVATIEGPQGEAKLKAADLGRGPVRLHALATPDGARSAPVWVSVE